MCVWTWVYNTILKAGASVLQVERTPSSSQWKHCQMSYAIWHCMTFSHVKSIWSVTFFHPSSTSVICCLDAELLRLPGCWKNTDYILRYHVCAVGLLYAMFFCDIAMYLTGLPHSARNAKPLFGGSFLLCGWGCPYMKVCLWPPKSLPCLWYIV